MISLEGLTLTTGRHAEAGYILRTFAHHVRDGLIPNYFPRRRERRASTTRPTRRCGSSTPCTATSHVTGDRDTLRRCCRRCRTSSTTTCAARASASASTRRTGCCGKGPRATSSRGWTPRSATGSSRRGAARRSRSTPCGTTPCGCWRAGCARTRRRRGGRRVARATPTGPASRSTRASGTSRAGYLYDVVDGERRRRPGLPAQPGVRHLARPPGAGPRRAGSRCWRWSRERLLTPVGPALAGAGAPRLQAALLRRPAGPRRGVSPGDGLGLADRAVHRRLAARCIPRTAPVRGDFLKGFGRT